MSHADPAHLRGAARAILTAGPLFVTLYLAADLYRRIPDAITVDWGVFIALPLILLFALIFGPLIAAVPIVIGTAAMQGLARHWAPLDNPLAWLLAGLAIGLGAAHGTGLLQQSGNIAFALIATCTICAGLSYRPPA